jgi:cation:H+ antiporter
LAVGDVIGTNVTIVTVALGLSALLTPIVMPRSVRRQALLATVVSAFPVGLLVFGYVSRLAGVFLLLAFAAYTVLLFRIDPAALAPLEEGDGDDDAPRTERSSTAGISERATNQGAHRRAVALTLGGLLAIAVGGPALVEGALRLASLVGVGGGVIGLTIVSLGTGAEMIALGVSAARKHTSEVLVGGILGSFAYNLLVTLGLAAVVRPLPVDPHLTRIALPVMVAAHLALLIFVWRGQMSRLMGALFVIAYAGYLVTVVAAH